MENIGRHTEAHRASIITAPIKFDLAGTCGITIDEFTNANGESVYRITTTDYMVNEWSEYFGTLSLALARVATLTACVEEEQKNPDETMLAFRNDPVIFADHAQTFIDGEVK